MIYNQRNRVEISITKKQLKEMSKEANFSIMDLNNLLEKILTTTHKSTLSEINHWIDENVPEIEIIIDNEIVDNMKDMLRDNLKLNLASSRCKDGRFYRIRFGTFLEHDLVGPLNEDKDKRSYQFMEKMVDFAYNRTMKNLEDNYEKYCPNKEVQEYLHENIKVICKFSK